MFKVIFLGIAIYLVYTYWVKPKPQIEKPSDPDRDNDGHYVPYEEIED